jgi:cell division protein FtsB
MAAMDVELPDDRPAPEPKARARRRLHAPGEARTRHRRILAYGLFVFSAVLMVNAFVGDNGYLATLRAQREYEALTEALATLQAENERLADETRRLKTDPAALEEAARRELGLIRPGETLVIVKDARPARPAPDDRQPR